MNAGGVATTDGSAAACTASELALRLLLAVALLIGCGGDASPPTSHGEPPERIIFVVADTLRRDFLSPYHDRVATPAIERLARDGQVFSNAVASFHQTSMSVASMFTGRTPSLESGERGSPLPWTSRAWCGMARFADPEAGACLPDRLDTLAEDMKAAGYATMAVVSNRLVFRPYGYDQGFDSWIELGEPERPEDRESRRAESLLRTGERVNDAVAKLLAERKSDRFFLYVHYIDPHDYHVRPDFRHYPDAVRYLDRSLGVLLDRLEDEGLMEDAAVVFTSDHGEYFAAPHPVPPLKKHFGNPSFEAVLLVPLIVAPPTNANPDQLVRTQDIRNLIRGIAGLAALPPQDTEPEEILLTERYYQTYRREDWKSMWPRNGDDAILFDLTNDPGETRDVAAQHSDVVAAHGRRIAELASQLATKTGSDAELGSDDEERLRALGYLE